MHRHLALSLLLFAVSAHAADEARHPVGRFVDLKGSESFEFTADHKIGIGLKGQPDYMSGTIAYSSTRELSPGFSEHTFEMTFLNPKGTRGVLTCKAVFTFLRNDEVMMRNLAGGAGCPTGAAHLGQAMELFAPRPTGPVSKPKLGAAVVTPALPKPTTPVIVQAPPTRTDEILLPAEDEDDAESVR